MKKRVAFTLAVVMFLSIVSGPALITVLAKDKKETVSGKSYDLGEKDTYELSKAQEVSDTANRFYVMGNISSVGTQNGFVSYAVDSGNLKLLVNDQFGKNLFEPGASTDWHIVTDKSKVVDSTELSSEFGSPLN